MSAKHVLALVSLTTLFSTVLLGNVVSAQGYVDITAEREEELAYNGINGAAAPTPEDPYESTNRAIFGFNEAVDDYFLEPVAEGYEYIVPAWGRDRIGSALSNIQEPVTFFNSVFQGDVDNAFGSFWRFVLNTTIGIGGLFDQAQYAGLPKQREDFGQTLGTYGSEGGSYIVLPILGPSNSRDTVGLVVDSLTNPFNYLPGGAVAGITGSRVVHGRSEVLDLTKEIDRTSFDPYSAYRSAYTQRRNALINNQKDNSDKPE